MTLKSVLKKKSLGILIHPSSLPGGSYCGTFGEGAKDWIKKLSKHRIKYWQFLPLTPTDSSGSPYSSPSSFALNPWFLDINDLIAKRFIFSSNVKELQSASQNESYFDFDHANNLSKTPTIVSTFLYSPVSVSSLSIAALAASSAASLIASGSITPSASS